MSILLDRALPDFDVVERHETVVRASASAVFHAVRNTDLLRDPVVRLLIRARGLGGGRITIESLGEAAFVVVAEEPDREIVLGRIGRFWQPRPSGRGIDAADFAAFEEPGWAKAAWNFRVEPDGDRTVLKTETRVRATDASSRRKFRVYWLFIGPFSGLIRKRALALIKREAERG